MNKQNIERRIMFRITVVSIALLLLAGVATAAIAPGDRLLTFNGGYSAGKLSVRD